MKLYDAAVLGLGAVGSAAAFQLARRGAKVVGIDRFAPPHEFGSSHGGTRITREAIGEGKYLTPFAQRSHVLWRQIEQQTGSSLFSETGLLILSGDAKTSFTHVEDFFANTIAAAQENRVAHDILTSAEIRQRFPQFRIRDDERGYWEPRAGFLSPEACITAQLALARDFGADLRINERVTAFGQRADNAWIESEKGSYAARTLVVAAGSWLPELLDKGFARLFRVFRQVMFWFEPPDESFRSPRFPVFIWELSGPGQALYGFPDIDGSGVKIATEQFGHATTAGEADRRVSDAECRSMQESYVAPFLPGLETTCTRGSVCLYTVTPDFGFVLDRHPGNDRIILASCCSGHGFKHSAAIGELLAEIILDGRGHLDFAPFRLARLAMQ